MKRYNIALLTAFALASVLAQSVAEDFTPYSLSADWTNSEAFVWSVDSGPRTPSGGFPAFAPSISVTTDGTGKIFGSGTLGITYNASGIPFSFFVVDLVGKISSTPKQPTAKATITVKGYGYTADGLGGAKSSTIYLKFTGAPGPSPSNPGQTRLVGTLEGNLKGETPLGAKSARISGLVGYISSSSMDNATLLVDVLQSTKRMLVIDRDFAGSGLLNTNQNGYRASLKGIHGAKGVRFSLAGNMGSYTNSVGTNPVVFLAPVSVTMQGVALGQTVSGTASSVQAFLIAD